MQLIHDSETYSFWSVGRKAEAIFKAFGLWVGLCGLANRAGTKFP